jgi:hypothetical protein
MMRLPPISCIKISYLGRQRQNATNTHYVLNAKRLFEDVVLGSNARPNNMRQVFQMMLAYWVWLKKETNWVRGDVLSCEGARTAIQTMLQELL